jgi:hypothetical protein
LAAAGTKARPLRKPHSSPQFSDYVCNLGDWIEFMLGAHLFRHPF